MAKFRIPPSCRSQTPFALGEDLQEMELDLTSDNLQGIPSGQDLGTHLGLSENSVPHCTQWLMIIIPIKWLFHWEYTLFPDKPIWGYFFRKIKQNLGMFHC